LPIFAKIEDNKTEYLLKVGNQTMDSNSTAKIIIVDDQVANLTLLKELLSRRGYEVVAFSNARETLAYLEDSTADLFLLDVNMPDITGYQLCSQIKSIPRLRPIPVIFVSAVEETNIKIKSFLAGGVDYITRPYQVKELLARIQTQLNVVNSHEYEVQTHRDEITQLQRLNKLKDEFLQMVSHDLKTPLTVIISHSDLLKIRDKAYLENNQRSSEIIENIKQSALRMSQFVHDILDVAWIEAKTDVSRQLQNVDDMLQNCVKDISVLAQENNITIHYNPPVTNLYIFVAPNLFSHVFINLLTNAIKYTPNGGDVYIEVENLPTETRFIIRDTGIGIPPNAKALIFERFYRVETPEHLKRSGSGLGLSIVKSIIEQHDGQIEVFSEEGKGSTFVVTLPKVIAN
jgi:signal transduction histidine kinase